MSVSDGGNALMRDLRLDTDACRLLLSTPTDGSQDLYVSAMLGIPRSRVSGERGKLLGRVFDDCRNRRR